VAQKLLGAPTIGRGSALAGGGGGGSQRSQIRPHAAQNLQKQLKKTGGFEHFLAHKSWRTPFFAQKYLIDILPSCFLRNTLILTFFVTNALWSYTFSRFRKSYTPPAAQIRFKASLVLLFKVTLPPSGEYTRAVNHKYE
jgi:hypothetical protein